MCVVRGRKYHNGLHKQTIYVFIDLWFMQLTKPVKLLEAPSEQHHTVQFTSDGMYIYWVYVLRQQETFTHPVSGERVKEHPVYLHTLELKVNIYSMFILRLVYIIQ